MNDYPLLLSPVRVGRGNTVLKNRLIFPNASPHRLQGPEPFPAEGYRAFFAGLARAGAAGGIPVRPIGDCVEARKMCDAIGEGAFEAYCIA